MYHLVLRQYDGEHIRVQSEHAFDQSEIEYYEAHYCQRSIDNSQPYYDNQVTHDAVAVNIFQSG